jgi:hypothetical protein
MLTSTEALRRIHEGIGRWQEVNLVLARFVRDDDVTYADAEILVRESDFLDMRSERAWQPFLDPRCRWLNATLLAAAKGPVIALSTGRPDPADQLTGDEDIAIAVSIETKPVRLEQSRT